MTISPHARFLVIATGMEGVYVGTSPDGFIGLILDNIDSVSEFPREELEQLS